MIQMIMIVQKERKKVPGETDGWLFLWSVLFGKQAPGHVCFVYPVKPQSLCGGNKRGKIFSRIVLILGKKKTEGYERPKAAIGRPCVQAGETRIPIIGFLSNLKLWPSVLRGHLLCVVNPARGRGLFLFPAQTDLTLRDIPWLGTLQRRINVGLR